MLVQRSNNKKMKRKENVTIKQLKHDIQLMHKYRIGKDYQVIKPV